MSPGRDAYPAVRGFLYQVRSTVLRWLELDGQTILLCEHGEDIDHVRCFVEPTLQVEIQEHLLEQIKHSEKHVTLRSPQALEALANFYQTRAANPGRSIRMRYTTNATPGHEQGYTFPHGLAGIEALRRMTANEATADEIELVVETFRKVVAESAPLAASMAKTTAREQLRRFAVSASRDELVEFLQAIEWAVGQPQHDTLRNQLEDRLVALGFALRTNARRVSDRLIITVLELLSHQGPKQLDLDTLYQALQHERFSDADILLLDRLGRLEEAIGAELEQLKSSVVRVVAAVDDLAARLPQQDALVNQIVAKLRDEGLGLSALGIEEAAPAIDLPPVPPLHEVPRSGLVEGLLESFEHCVWLHLHGGAGMGKTLLAHRIVLNAHPPDYCWVSFTSSTARADPDRYLRDRIAAWITNRVGDQGLWLAYRRGQITIRDLIARGMNILGSGSILVLDDLPDLAAFPEIVDRIRTIALICRAAGTKLLTTGQRALHLRVRDVVPVRLVVEFMVPPMGTLDALEMLRVAGAPDTLREERFAEILTQASRGHPALIAATIRWLERRAWAVDSTSLMAVFTGTAAVEEREAAHRQMVQLVEHPQQREMVCRLSLIGRQFGQGELEAVASVDPALDRPWELLAELVGPWINALADGRYDVTPLLADAGRRLPATQQQHVHRRLADWILREHEISFDEAFYAVLHLSGAEEWLRLADLVVQLMMTATGTEQARSIGWVTLLFRPHAWPNSIPLAFRLMVRAFQVKMARLAGDDAEPLDADLEQLLLAAGEGLAEQLAVLMALVNSGPFLQDAPVERTTRRALRAMRILKRHPDLFEDGHLKEHLSNLLWLPVSRVKDLGDVLSVVSVLREMSSEELGELFKADLALHGSEMLADRCWLDMHFKPKGERDWDRTMGVLAELESVATEHNLETLLCMVLHARAVILAEYLERGDEALQLLRDAPPPQNQDCLLFLRYRVARILDDMGRGEEAIREYERALTAGGEEFVYLRFRTYVEAAVACGRSGNWEGAMTWSRRGIAFAGRYRKASFSESGIH